MSTTESPAFASPSTSGPPANSAYDDQGPLPFPIQNTSHDSSQTPTQSPRHFQTSHMDAETSNDSSTPASGYVDGSRNAGLSMGTPLPSAPPPPTHAQATHLQPPFTTGTHIVSESPSSIGSSAPSSSPGLASASNLTSSRRHPSPPLPSLPPSARSGQISVSRSSTGPSTPGRSLSFLDPPNRSGTTSGSVRTSSGNGSNYNTINNNSNGSRIAGRNYDPRTMSSIGSSLEKAGMSPDSDASRVGVYQIDLGYGDRSRDSRYHDSAIAMPMPILTQTYDARERDFDATGRGRFNHTRVNVGGGGGGDGGGGPGGTGLHRDSDSIYMPRFPRTVQERLQPTLDHAMAEEAKYARKAKMHAYSLNVAIGLQIFVSAFITGLAAITTGRQTSIVTAILGGIGTVVGSYLARARGSNEPELSIARTKDLERFVRTCDAFVQDHGQETGFEGSEEKEGGGHDLRRARELDDRIRELRNELEHLLGNGDGERRLAPV